MDLVRVTRSLLRDAIKIFVSPQKKVESNSGTIAAWNFSAGFLITTARPVLIGVI